MNQVYNNVEKLMQKFEGKVRNDKHLLLLYYKFIDKIDVDKDSMSTKDFLDKATCPVEIINAKIMYEVVNN